MLLSVLAAGLAVSLTVAALLLAAPDRPEGWASLRLTLQWSGVAFLVAAGAAVLPSALGVLGMAGLTRRTGRVRHWLHLAIGLGLALAAVAAVLGTVRYPLWLYAGVGGIAGTLAASLSLAARLRARP